ncbi:hypothetical protein KKB18_01000, partial [bacterium]|nr:hypothetical protein [bacterium]
TIIEDNSALHILENDGQGGGICSYQSTLTLNSSELKDNHADWFGGGILLYDSSSTVAQNKISGNTCSGLADTYSSYSSASKTDYAHDNSDSLMSELSPVMLDSVLKSTFLQNSNEFTGGFGGGVLSVLSSFDMTESDLSGNTALYGGGILLFESSSEMLSTSIEGNHAVTSWGAGGAGGGMCCFKTPFEMTSLI